jgi:hypothetical protein
MKKKEIILAKLKRLALQQLNHYEEIGITVNGNIYASVMTWKIYDGLDIPAHCVRNWLKKLEAEGLVTCDRSHTNHSWSPTEIPGWVPGKDEHYFKRAE